MSLSPQEACLKSEQLPGTSLQCAGSRLAEIALACSQHSNRVLHCVVDNILHLKKKNIKQEHKI